MFVENGIFGEHSIEGAAQLVNEIDKRLQLDGARLMLGWSKEYVVMWPYVKNVVPHQSIYNYGRMQEVWLDK